MCADVFIFFISVTQYKVDFDTCLLKYNKIQKVEYTLRQLLKGTLGSRCETGHWVHTIDTTPYLN